MGMVKANQIKQSDILRLEAEMNNLWGELKSSNIPQATREAIEKQLSLCEEQLKLVLGGQASVQELENKLHKCDIELAKAVVQQAENELPKSEHTSGCFLALENIRKELDGGSLTPVKARHEAKTIMRHHT